MHIKDAGDDVMVLRVDDFAARADVAADLGNAPVDDADVGFACRGAAAVDDDAITDQEIESHWIPERTGSGPSHDSVTVSKSAGSSTSSASKSSP